MILSFRSRRLFALGVPLGILCILLLSYSSRDTNGSRWAAYRALHKPKTLAEVRQQINPHALDSKPLSQLVAFWAATLDAMLKADPAIKAPQLIKSVPEPDLDPKYVHQQQPPRQDYVVMTAADKEKMKTTHSQMVRSAMLLGPRVPYAKQPKSSAGSRGIVMTAGGEYIHNAVFSLHMLRRSGSRLPVQLFIDGEPGPAVRSLCQGRLYDLGVECRSINRVLHTTPHMPQLLKYQYKAFALLFSSFDDVLFLDADCFPVINPDNLFDSEPYRSHGLVTWPDFWSSSASPTFYEVTGTKEPRLDQRRSSESSVMMLKRSTHGSDLVLATYYNLWGPEKYYRLLSQSAPGEGDKETFLHAALALDQPFWDIRTPVAVLGRWVNGSFEGYGMKQADPAEDYRLWRDDPGADHNLVEATERHARRMFIHHNNLKIDMMRLDDLMDNVGRTNEHGRISRLWGDDQTLIDQSGYDVEKVMWETVLTARCQQDPLAAGCGRLRGYYESVFGGQKSMAGQ